MKQMQWALAAAAILGLTTAVAVAQVDDRDPSKDAAKPARPAPSTTVKTLPAEAGTFHRASSMIGMTVKGENNAELGEVEDLLVNSETSRIEYLVLDTGVLADLGGKQPVIPWALVDIHRGSADERTMMIPLTADRLKSAPSFNVAEVQLTGKAPWITQIQTFYDADLKQRRVARPDLDDRDDRPSTDRDDRPSTDRDEAAPKGDSSIPKGKSGTTPPQP